jgi:2-polyprenyl-3-methyl-5-hydroxy-6-metoxy-1,4-benzoquinol methylase
MQNLPTSKVYEKEFKYMPWGNLIKEVEAYVIKHAPKEGTVLDLLCGPGYLLGKLQKQRKDLKYHGIDLETEFIKYAKKTYPNIAFEVADVLRWKSGIQYDVILCTGGLHHLPFKQQEPFIKKLSQIVKKEGFVIIADPYIDDFSSEQDRKIAGAKLGFEYLIATIRKGATSDVIKATIDIMSNDVLLIEYKNSIKKVKPLLKEYFTKLEQHKTWPKGNTDYGDYYFILKP